MHARHAVLMRERAHTGACGLTSQSARTQDVPLLHNKQTDWRPTDQLVGGRQDKYSVSHDTQPLGAGGRAKRDALLTRSSLMLTSTRARVECLCER